MQVYKCHSITCEPFYDKGQGLNCPEVPLQAANWLDLSFLKASPLEHLAPLTCLNKWRLSTISQAKWQSQSNESINTRAENDYGK